VLATIFPFCIISPKHKPRLADETGA
jgi:hypothetical protein